MTMTHRSIVRISFAAALVWTSGCSEPSVEKVETAAAVPVSVEVAKTDTIEGVISVTGTVTPAPGAEITIVAPEPARIAELPKAEGDAVAAGDLLVRFDIPSRPAEVAARRAEVAQATVRLTTARAAVTRLTGLVERGVASAREVEEAKREEADAQAALDQAQSAVTATEALAARSVVRATFAGAIAKRFHNVGDLVESSASDPILRVVDPKRLQVTAAVPIADLPKLNVGRSATVSTPGSEDGVAARVVAIPPEIEPDRATAGVRLAFASPTRLPSNAPVTVEIMTESHKSAVIVPAAAVVRGEDGTFVFVVGADNKAHKQAVTIGLASREDVEITEGVKAGDKVIVHGHEGLPDGAIVTIKK